MKKVLEARGVDKVFEEGSQRVEVLRGVSMDVSAGEVVALEGPSGSGKTTLLSILGCILTPTRGEIAVAGETIDSASPSQLREVRRRSIGFVFQQYNLFPALTALENVEYALNVKGRTRGAHEEAQQVLARVGLADRMHFLPRDLSGGQKQRVAIARALAGSPQVLLADEPTANLDSVVGASVLELFRDLAKRESKGLLIVTHDPKVRDIADRVVGIRDGPAGRTGASGDAAAAMVTAPRRVAAEGRVVTYPGAEVRVGSDRAGRLVEVRFVEGASVRKGDVLAVLESDELTASITAAAARFAEAEAEVRLAELTRERRRALVAERIAAPSDLDQADRDLEIARARRATAAAETVRLQAQLRKTRIVAPIDGTVTARAVDPGETVEIGDAVATIADLRRLRVDGEADEADADALAVGAEVEVSADGYPGQAWAGRIEEVAESVTLRALKPQDPGRPTDTRILAVKVALPERTPLRLGTTVELKITPRR
jgi:putative ABC transport system ATP-binding protein